jgi:hypothetical protein
MAFGCSVRYPARCLIERLAEYQHGTLTKLKENKLRDNSLVIPAITAIYALLIARRASSTGFSSATLFEDTAALDS